MPEGALSGEIREAIEELQAYLSDQVAPLLIVDSVHVLLAQPPELGAEVVRSWVGGQLRNLGAAVNSTDILFHAVKKLQLFGKLKLVEREPLAAYLDGLVEVLVAQAPELDRGSLRTFLLQAAEAETGGLASQVQVLYRPATAAAPAGAAPPASASAQVSAEMAASMRQFALLLSRLDRGSERVGGGEQRGMALGEQAPQLLAAAAQSARSQGELEQHLASLSRLGLMTNVRLSELFNTLSHGLPNWALGEGAPAHESAPVQAMHRIVALAGDPGKAAGHFRELLNTVAKQFNDNALAARAAGRRRRPPAARRGQGREDERRPDDEHGARGPRRGAADGGDAARRQPAAAAPPAQLLPRADARGAAADARQRARPLAPPTLAGADGGPRAVRAARPRSNASTQSLQAGAASDHEAWLQRNFVYLLHRMRPAAGEDPAREIRLTVRCADLALPAPLVREALTNLGLRRHPEAEAALRLRLEQIERQLEQPTAGVPHDAAELRRMLGLVVAGLARQATSSARRTIVDHGLKQRPALGDTLERLGELGGYDLAEDPEIVDRLLATLRTQLPMKVLGLQIRRHDIGPVYLVKALHSTRSPAVRQIFEDIAARFPSEAFGQAAAAALASWNVVAAPPPEPEVSSVAAPPPAPAASLAGDLEVFGLPELLQTLSQNESSGRLLLRDRNGHPFAELLLRKGMVREARVRRLTMPDAFYQILEAPQPGTFEFSRLALETVPDGPAHHVMGLLMEGMRRYDELQRARVVAPDHVLLRSTGSRPSAPPDESDGNFIRELWMKVKDGGTPLQCEEAVAADTYRIRSLLAHWLTEGTLAVREAPENAAP